MRMTRLFGFILIGSAVYAHTANKREFVSAYANRDVAIEADPQSAFWRGAPFVYPEVDKEGHRIPGYRTA